MDLENVSKYLKLQQFPTYTEVKYNGQPCLAVMENYDGGYSWVIAPLFARMTYGANTLADIPYCTESFDDIAEAIADGTSRLHELGSFIELDLDDIGHEETIQECKELALEYADGDIFKAVGYLLEFAKIEEVSKCDIPAVQRKAKGGDWKVTTSDLKKEREEKISSPEGIKKLAKEKLSENVFTDWMNKKSSASTYELPGHVVMDTKSGPNGETHVKRISSTGHVTTTKYGAGGNVVGKQVHDEQDPAPYFKSAGKDLSKASKGRGRPRQNGDESSTHDAVKSKIEKGEELSRYEKYIAKKHGLIAAGKRGRPRKVAEEFFSSRLDELSNEKLGAYKAAAYKAASDADKKNDFDTGHKRFVGILKATRKQFDNDSKQKNEDTQLDEKITPSTPTSDVIRDFLDSDAPQFKGKSKAERIKMALGASYGSKNK